jgi:hypothetical protein
LRQALKIRDYLSRVKDKWAARSVSAPSKEEILEVISVVVSMRGTTGVAESLRVIQLLDELGNL